MKRPLKVPAGLAMGLLLLSMPPFFEVALAILLLLFLVVLLGHSVLHLLRDLRDFREGY